MQHILIEFSLCFSFHYHHLEQRKKVDSQLNHEVDFQSEARSSWPVGVVLVNLRTRPATAHHGREPVIVTEHHIGHYRDESVENGIERQLQNRSMLVRSLFSFVLGVDDRFNLTAHEVEPTVLDHEDAAEPYQTPHEGVNGKHIDILADAMVPEVDESFDTEHQD